MEEKNSGKKERKMRDSGIPWIGEVPEGWKIGKIKNCCTLIGSGTTPSSHITEYYDNEKINWIQSGDIYGKIKIFDVKTRISTKAVLNNQTLKIYKAPFIVMAMYGGSVGNTAISMIDACTNQACCCLKPDDDTDFMFLYYWVQFCKDNFLMKAEGGGQPNISQEKIKNQYFCAPLITEQHRIADFLDSKCSEIDTLVENLRARMESAKEYKKAVITEAVTKGLDKDVKMKDSGVEWIGEIPEGWRFPKITHILDYTHLYPIGDGDHGSIKATDYSECGIPFIRVQNLGFATDLCLDNVVYISEAQNRTIQNSTLKPNDILFAKTGATIGKVGIVPESIKKANTTSHVGKITVSESIVPKYIFYVLSSNIGYRQFWDIAAQKSTRPELSIDEIKTIRVLLPKTKEEQRRIVDYLDSKCSEIDALLQNYEDQIATLEEYKKSLIYEYVTGKKEVC